MSELKIGKIIKGDQHPDAIHIAVVPMIAKHGLLPGQHVGLCPGSVTEAENSINPIGVVDPFLKVAVYSGEKFWLFLYPDTAYAQEVKDA